MDIEKLQKSLDEIKEKKIRAESLLDSTKETMKNEYGCDTIEEFKKLYEEKLKEYEKSEKELSILTEEIEKIIEENNLY